MIGSLLFYVVFPLCRYLNSRVSETSKKGLSPAPVNGTPVWDGGGVAVGFTQTALLDQRRETKMDTEERIEEPGPERDNNRRPDMEPLTAVPHEDTKIDTASQMNEEQFLFQAEVETPRQEEGEMVIQPKEDRLFSPVDCISPEQLLVARLKCLQTEDTEDGKQDTTAPVWEQIQKQTLKVVVTSVEESIHRTSCPVHKQIHMQMSGVSAAPTEDNTCSCSDKEQVQAKKMETSQIQAKIPSEVTECWDEYLLSTGDAASDVVGNSEVFFSSLFSSTQNPAEPGQQQDEKDSLHFRAGPGIAQEQQCQLWNCPAASYYPPMEPTESFDIMWRLWEESDQMTSLTEPALIPFPLKKVSMDFTVMSYNILAQDLLELNQQLYIHCPLEVLDWSYRCTLLLAEIEKWAPDILCLQEVQENHYHEHLHPVLSQMGYTCVYKRRTGTKTDGCATCFRSGCFSEVTVTKVEFFRPEAELLNRHNVGIVLLLRPVVTRGAEVKKGPPLCVANTHLLFNPRRGDVKIAQLAIMLAEIDAVVKSCISKGEHCNVIFCGDFNSLPNMPLYQLITSGELYYHGLPAWMVSGQEDLSYKPSSHRLFAPLWPSSMGITDHCQYTSVNNIFESQNQKSGKYKYNHDFMLRLRYCPAACVRPRDLKLILGVTDNTPDATRDNHHYDQSFRHKIRHRLDLESVHKHVFPDSGSPDVTTLHSEGGAVVDYIFYSPKRICTSGKKAAGNFAGEGLKLVGTLSLLSEDVLWSMGGLPNHIFPSDHLSVVARFQLDLNSTL